MRYFLLTLTIFCLPYIFIACCTDEYIVKDYNLSFYLNNQYENYDNDTLIVSSEEDSLILNVGFNLTEVEIVQNISTNFNSFALTCDEDYSFESPIKKIDFISLFNYDEQHLSGADLNNLIYFHNRYDNTYTQLTENNIEYPKSVYTFDSFEFIFPSLPTLSTTQQFVVKITHQNDLVKEFTSSLIIFN